MNPYLSRKISTLSFIAAILVVFIHAYNLYDAKRGQVHYGHEPVSYIEDLISQGFARIAVPLFFLFSGYLFFLNVAGHRPGFIPKLKKRVQTLLIPYLIWSSLGLLMLLGFSNMAAAEPRSLSALDVADRLLIHPVAYPLWFLRDLIILSAVSPVLYLILRYTRWLAVVVCAGLWFCQTDGRMAFTQSLCFFSLGACISLTHPAWMLRVFARPGWSLLMLLWAVVLFVKVYLFHDLTEADRFAEMTHKLGIILGLFAVWTFYDVWMAQEWPVWNIRQKLGSGFAFFLFAFHEPNLSTAKKVLHQVLPGTPNGTLLQYVAAPILTILVISLCTLCLQRYLPWVYRVLTGYR